MKNLFIFFLIFKITLSYINIYPTNFDKKIDYDGSYQEFILFNQSNNSVLYRIYLEEDVKNINSSMVSWMNFYPRSLTLKPGESGKIQLSIASYKKLKEKEYFGILGIREIPIYKESKRNNQSNISIFTDLKLVLTGFGGDIFPILKTENIKIYKNKNTFKIYGFVKNIGKRRGRFKLYLGDIFLGNLLILPKEKLKLEDFNFSFNLKKKKDISNILIFKDYKSKKIVKKVKI